MEIRGMINRVISKIGTSSIITVTLEDMDEMTCKGFCPYKKGDYVFISGSTVEHPKYGTQMVIDTIARDVPHNYRLLPLLFENVDTVSPIAVSRIVKRYREDTASLIREHPEKLSRIIGVSKEQAAEIHDHYMSCLEDRKKAVLLMGYGLHGKTVYQIGRCFASESDLKYISEKNPYLMCEFCSSFGFADADLIAKKNGISASSDLRIHAGIRHILKKARLEGNTCLPVGILAEQTARFLHVEKADVSDTTEYLLDEKDLCSFYDKSEHAELVFLPEQAGKESEIAIRLKRLNAEHPESLKDFDAKIKKIEQQSGITLDPVQKDAVREAVSHGVCTVTGGPGTGKTTTIRTIISYLRGEHLRIEMAAPTGKAAKRMTESVGEASGGKEAMTIHRLLGVKAEEDGSGFHFTHDESVPIDTDAIVIDECSMLDNDLAWNLMKALGDRTRVIFVGDINQLPSVGPGNLLKDIIESAGFPCVRLTKVFRQKGGSSIIDNAYKINSATDIDYSKKDGQFFCLQRTEKEAVCRDMLYLIREWFPKFVKNADPMSVQILCPQRKGAVGVESLNLYFQEALNPPAPDKNEIRVGDHVFREGDKVMNVRNNYRMEWTIDRPGSDPNDPDNKEKGTGIFNGDTGIIASIHGRFGGSVITTVAFDDGRRADYERGDLDALELSYAVTIHKSQGSEYPAVIIPVLQCGTGTLFNKNLLYTGVTRAKGCCVLIGEMNTFHKMTKNKEAVKRYTGLKKCIESVS